MSSDFSTCSPAEPCQAAAECNALRVPSLPRLIQLAHPAGAQVLQPGWVGVSSSGRESSGLPAPSRRIAGAPDSRALRRKSVAQLSQRPCGLHQHAGSKLGQGSRQGWVSSKEDGGLDVPRGGWTSRKSREEAGKVERKRVSPWARRDGTGPVCWEGQRGAYRCIFSLKTKNPGRLGGLVS